MSNYPPGSMVGSGIYSYDFEATVSWECPQCGHAHECQDVIVDVNDYGSAYYYQVCANPSCDYDQSVADDAWTEYDFNDDSDSLDDIEDGAECEQ